MGMPRPKKATLTETVLFVVRFLLLVLVWVSKRALDALERCEVEWSVVKCSGTPSTKRGYAHSNIFTTLEHHALGYIYCAYCLSTSTTGIYLYYQYDDYTVCVCVWVNVSVSVLVRKESAYNARGKSSLGNVDCFKLVASFHNFCCN